MIDKLIELEKNLDNFAVTTNLNQETLLIFPENLRRIHTFTIFGNDLLAIPANLKIKGDDNEFEIPFSFLDNLKTIEIFEREFRPEIPEEFIQIGNLYGSTEFVLLNKTRNTVHIFHVSDIADQKWIKHKLENEICDLETFIENIRLQTVCCLLNPKNYSEYSLLEIRNKVELKSDLEIIRYPDEETTWKEYLKIVENAITNGYEIHYAPTKVKIEIKK